MNKNVEWLSTNQMVSGLIPDSCSLHVEVSTTKILNPKLLPIAVPSVCECVYVNAGLSCKAF